jgi:hypothetical protein
MSVTSSIIFKLKAATKLDVVKFDGRTIKSRDARKLIAARIGCQEVEIELFRGPTQLTGEEDLAASTQIEVERRNVQLKGKPLSAISKAAIAKAEASNIFGAAAPGAAGAKAAASVVGAADMTEEERIAMLNEDTGRANANVSGYGPRGRGRGGGPGGPGGRGGGGGGGMTTADGGLRPPPANYICHACGKGGHFIEHCPNRTRMDGKRFLLPTGISEANLERVAADDPTAKFITKDGHWVRRRVDGTAFASAAPADESTAPEELRCPRCKKLFEQALELPCCEKFICSPCLDALVAEGGEDDGPPECPLCQETLLAD